MVQKALKDLPKDLYETYNRILCSIDQAHSEYALTILRWLAFSERPLITEELHEVTGIRIDDDAGFDADEVLTDSGDLLRICPSLITIVWTASTRIPIAGLQKLRKQIESGSTRFSEYSDSHAGTDTRGTERNSFNAIEREDENKFMSKGEEIDGDEEFEQDGLVPYVRLAHFSVKEYLLSDYIQRGPVSSYHLRFGDSNDALARSCLVYLLRYETKGHFSPALRYAFPLADYSAQFWCEHARNLERGAIEPSQGLKDLALRLLTKDSAAFQAWIWLQNVDVSSRYGPVPTPLFAASEAGILFAARAVLRRSTQDLNFHGDGDTALTTASCEGHVEIVELLLDSGADVNARGGAECTNPTALEAAAEFGHEEVTKLLLARGADVNAPRGPDPYGSASLRIACSLGYEKIAEILLSYNAVDIGGKALQAATWGGCSRNLIDRLIRSGSDVNAKDWDPMAEDATALDLAAKMGRYEIVEVLLAADIQGEVVKHAMEKVEKTWQLPEEERSHWYTHVTLEDRETILGMLRKKIADLESTRR